MIFSSPLLQSSLLTTPTLLSSSSLFSSPVNLKRSSIVASASAAATCESQTTNKLASSSVTTSFYEVLGIQMGASSEEIKAAYRRRARVCHPDVVAIDRKDTSSDEFMSLHAAYSTLSDPDKRAEYDRRLFRRHRSGSISYSDLRSPGSSAGMSRYNGYAGRNWETDQCW